jgi:hypothetical protein
MHLRLTHIDRNYLSYTALQETVSKTTRRRSSIKRSLITDVNSESSKRSLQLDAATRHELINQLNQELI